MRKIGKRIIDKRIKFKTGYQKLFLKKIKIMSKLTWKEFSESLNLCEHTVMFDWGSEKTTIPLSIAKDLLKKYPFTKWKEIERSWIKEILEKYWGQKKAGEFNKKIIKIPKECEELAELLGVILGDGHLDKKTLTITGNSLEKSHYIYLSKNIKKLFGLDSKITLLKNWNAMRLRVNSIELIKYLQKNGMVIGNKIKNNASLPLWVFKKDKFVYSILRGLFDTDGGIYQKQKNYKRAIIEFQTKSPNIRESIYCLLRKINFRASKSSGNVRIQNQQGVLNFFNVVGSSNPKNIVRYNHFIKKGFIPLKGNLKKEIINLKADVPFKADLV